MQLSVRALVEKVLTHTLLLLGDKPLQRVCSSALRHRSLSLEPDKAMRFLLQIENDLYALEGPAAMRYGQGEHAKHRLMRYHDFFVARIKPGERVLDVGCGTGAVACDVAQRSQASVVGIDLDPANIATARARYVHPQVEYREGNVLTDLPGERFDVVILSNVLEHLPDRPAFLQRLVHAVRPTRLLIRVPLLERDWRVPLKRELKVEFRLDPTHEVEYTLAQFRQEMQQAGLRIMHEQLNWGELWAEVTPGAH